MTSKKFCTDTGGQTQDAHHEDMKPQTEVLSISDNKPPQGPAHPSVCPQADAAAETVEPLERAAEEHPKFVSQFLGHSGLTEIALKQLDAAAQAIGQFSLAAHAVGQFDLVIQALEKIALAAQAIKRAGLVVEALEKLHLVAEGMGRSGGSDPVQAEENFRLVEEAVQRVKLVLQAGEAIDSMDLQDNPHHSLELLTNLCNDLGLHQNKNLGTSEQRFPGQTAQQRFPGQTVPQTKSPREFIPRQNSAEEAIPQ